jgi:hypothetical protein
MRGLSAQGVPARVAHHVASLPPVSSLFSTVLGTNPIRHLLAPSGALSRVTAAQRRTLTGHRFFPHLISGPFHQGLVIVFSLAIGLSVVAAIASLLRGGRYVPPRGEGVASVVPPAPVAGSAASG